MALLKKIYLLLFIILFFISGCSTGKLFYDFGDEMVSWQIDNYFDLTSKQEEWIEERLRSHLDWFLSETFQNSIVYSYLHHFSLEILLQ